ncbi:MAG: hypothetical protein ACE5NC_12675 [Anaerolineae bacterium]
MRDPAGPRLIQVGVFTATRGEFNAVRNALVLQDEQRVGGYRAVLGRRGHAHVILVRTGLGVASGEVACREALTRHPLELAISSGFACALSASAIGDLLVGTEVLVSSAGAALQSGAHVISCSKERQVQAMRAAREADVTARAGRFVTVPHVICRAEEKRAVAVMTGAIGLDMESAAVGAVAAERGTPFLILRTVSDLPDEDLPLDFNLFLSPSGWMRGTFACLTHPSCLLGLKRLRAQVARASEGMSRFFVKFLEGLE